MQLYALTTVAPTRDFWLLHYMPVMEYGSLVVCERSLHNTQNGPSMVPVQHFPWSVPEVTRPLSQLSTLLAQKTTMAYPKRDEYTILFSDLTLYFNEAVTGFTDEGWSVLDSDGIDDVTVLVNSSLGKLMGLKFLSAM
ncbi:unnamed protein product [Coffea canephora]|uniref:START domain-containing protein n=1 Tax=Coffea canephora TaxID=49390 RepID=A0A068V0R2_COFCA|nr:unnamed protein product [Coffea canephora]